MRVAGRVRSGPDASRVLGVRVVWHVVAVVPCVVPSWASTTTRHRGFTWQRAQRDRFTRPHELSVNSVLHPSIIESPGVVLEF